MTELFLHVVNLSISASWLILAVLIARLVLRRAPKWTHVLLWGIVAVRLLFPFSLESAWSLIPSAETVPTNLLTHATPTVHTGVPTLNQGVNPVLEQAATTAPAASTTPLQFWTSVLAVIWVVGAVALLGYAALSALRLRRRVATAVRLEGNLYQSEAVLSPFVLGLFRPRIYLPFCLDPDTLDHVVAHERAHIRRLDHWWKPLGFVLLSVYWFNPLLWLAYVLLCRDMELACDEKVVGHMDPGQRADYSQALLSCSSRRSTIAACPLAFGEVGVKQRVKSVLRYQRPTVVAVAASVLVCAIVGVCFLTNPPTSRSFPMQGHNVSDLDPQAIVSSIARVEGLDDANLYTTSTPGILTLTADFDLAQSEGVDFYYFRNQEAYSTQLRYFLENDTFYVVEPVAQSSPDQIYLLETYLEALKYLPQEEIRQLAPQADQYQISIDFSGESVHRDPSITYTADGVGNLNGWLVHLTLLPLYKNDDSGYHSSDGFINLYYGPQPAETVATYLGTSRAGQMQLLSPDTSFQFESPYLELLQDGTFIWSTSTSSSQMTLGYYQRTEDTLTLYTNSGDFVYVFDKEGDTLTYNANASTQSLPLEEWAYLPGV